MSQRTDADAASLWLTTVRYPRHSDRALIRLLGWSKGKFYDRKQDLLHPSDRLKRWLSALREGRIPDWRYGKMTWYPEVPDLIMIGTPPWGPNDFIHVRADGTLWVPRGIFEPVEKKHTYRSYA